MKYRLLFILTILTIPSLSQEIEKIIFTSQQADEPPTKQGQPKFTIEFTRQASGTLVASDFYENKRRTKLKDNTSIDKDRIERIAEWNKLNKRIFNQSELGLDITTLKARTNTYKLNFPIPTNLTINVDSFQICQAYKMTKSISTGGETITVTLAYKTGQEQKFIFDSNDIGRGDFNLKEYILCYTLLTDKIPNEVPSFGFFSKSKFTDMVLYYQKTVECEGYYFSEYTHENPNLTSQDRRMMITGWNFVEYMGQRRKKE